jgi:hypothetical protein
MWPDFVCNGHTMRFIREYGTEHVGVSYMNFFLPWLDALDGRGGIPTRIIPISARKVAGRDRDCLAVGLEDNDPPATRVQLHAREKKKLID